MILAMLVLCKQMKLRTLVTSLALQKIKEVGAVATDFCWVPGKCTRRLLHIGQFIELF